jgi:hypothetical protein
VVGAAAVVAASIATTAPASPTQSLGGTRFVLEYQGSFEGSWRTAYTKKDISGYRCGGDDHSGTFTSSVRPGSKPLTVVVATDLDGRSVYLDWRPGNGTVKGIVNSVRKADGWRLDYQQGACVKEPLFWLPNCGARTFSGAVSLAKDSKLTRNVQRVYLDWELEPYDDKCRFGQMWGAVSAPGEAARATLDLSKLHRCGVRKPRGCRFTIRGSHTHSHSLSQPHVDGVTTDVGKGRIQWSVTFVARGRS